MPEVKKKQEEKQKRIIVQSNRMRVEIFKKVRTPRECTVWVHKAPLLLYRMNV